MSLITGRERRANAGSRMKALLNEEAEMEDLFEAIESDEEFENAALLAVEEEDIVDSDFDVDSGDSEVEREVEGLEEDKIIAREERQARKFTIPTHKAPAVTKRQTDQAAPKERAPKVNRTIRPPKPSMAESMASAPRQSFRSATLQNRQHVEKQLKEYEQRRALIPKRDKPVIRTLTQEEMLAEAAITEEANIASLENWQQMEAERMAKAKRREKKKIVGPIVRYYSYTDGDESERPRKKRLLIIEEKNGKNDVTEILDKDVLEWMEKDVLEKSDMIGRNLIYFEGDANESLAVPHNRRAIDNEVEMWEQEEEFDLSNLSDGELDRIDLIPSLTGWLDKEPRPTHPTICPVTAKLAPYKDPATGVPYADTQAFRILRQCLDHSIVWSETYDAFITLPNQTRGAKGVPEGWEHMATGKLDGQPDWVIDGKLTIPTWLKKQRGIGTDDLEVEQNVQKQPSPERDGSQQGSAPVTEPAIVVPQEDNAQAATSSRASRRTRSRSK
ncbi:hypothetical protein NQZ79_g4478 [Umbelopsis isabellina]|nr:hypothetical protein NQZ79_g4478 [Umbelopsis isabellina]